MTVRIESCEMKSRIKDVISFQFSENQGNSKGLNNQLGTSNYQFPD